MLGFSWIDYFVTVGVVVVAFGPKEIPVVARNLGWATGQAVGKATPRRISALRMYHLAQ
jgi:Sec-independent protein translocase protein TatA